MGVLYMVLVLAGVLHVTHSLFVCPVPCACSQYEEADHPAEAPTLVVDCRKKQLTAIPPLDGLRGQRIFQLHLDRNSISSLPDYAFTNLTVHGVSLSDNPLVNISVNAFTASSGIKFLSLRRTKLLTPPRVFSTSLTALQVLDLSQIGTDQFSVIKPATFGLMPTLEQLILQQNNIASIAAGALRGKMPSLFMLDMVGNKLTQVPEQLAEVPGLAILHLDSNPLTGLSTGALSNLTQLQTLTLSDTHVESSSMLSADAMRGVEKTLHTLDLSTNSLGAAPCHILSSLTKLRQLKLRDTMITSIEPGCFEQLTELQLLDLSGNLVSPTAELLAEVQATVQTLYLERLDLTMDNLPLSVLSKMPALRELSLSGNSFPTLPPRAFNGLSITKLSLSYCGIDYIAPTAFDGLGAPLVLIVNNNNIKNLTFFENKCQFEKVELHRNPVNCDCAFYHVVRYDIIDFVGQCASPSMYSGIKLNDFKSDNNVTSVCGTMSGVKDTIICHWQYMRLPVVDNGTSALTGTLVYVIIQLIASVCTLNL